MTINELREAIQNARNELRTMRERGLQLANSQTATAQEMTDHTAQVNKAQARLQVLEDELRRREAEETPTADAPAQHAATDANTNPRLHAILSSNEYARAFAAAVRNGVTPRNGRGVEQYGVLYDALTIGGGNPAGTDGGFLVPEDVEHQIMELRRELNPLADLFNVESVTAPTGWRVMDNAPTTGMANVDEMGNIQAGEQPSFVKVPYSVDKYAMFLPVSNELLSDEVAGLMAYIARWTAKKMTITENTLLLAALDELTPSAFTAGAELAGIKSVLNVALDPAISLTASIVTNQDGFDLLDNLVDTTGRPLLNPDPKTGTPKLLGGRTVHVIANSVLPSTSTKVENVTTTTAPIYIGDFAQYATLFRRKGLEVLSTNVGGSSWRTDSTEVRAIARMGVSKFDTYAAVKRTMTL